MNDGGAQSDNRPNVIACPECGEATEEVTIKGFDFRTEQHYEKPGVACKACNWYDTLEGFHASRNEHAVGG